MNRYERWVAENPGAKDLFAESLTFGGVYVTAAGRVITAEAISDLLRRQYWPDPSYVLRSVAGGWEVIG